jgi:hypothetical protein
VFVVWGTKIHLMHGWHKVHTLDREEGRWTPGELIARKTEIFDSYRTKIPQFGFGE